MEPREFAAQTQVFDRIAERCGVVLTRATSSERTTVADTQFWVRYVGEVGARLVPSRDLRVLRCECESSLCDHEPHQCARRVDVRLTMAWVGDTCTQCASNMCGTGGGHHIELRCDERAPMGFVSGSHCWADDV